MHRIAAKFVPRLPTSSDDQKQERIFICTEFKQFAAADENFLARAIIDDETRVYDYDPETKQQSVEEFELAKTQEMPTSEKQYEEHGRCFFFDMKGIVHRKFVPAGRMVNSEFYCNVLRRFREDISRKRPNFDKQKIGSLYYATVRFLQKPFDENINDYRSPNLPPSSRQI